MRMSSFANISQITIVPVSHLSEYGDVDEEADNDCGDECHYFVVDIDRAVPLEYALPLYGFLMPLLVLITTAINSFIVVVLSQRHLRTPTNFILLAMAIADLMTGLSSVPWFVFYYTLRGFELDQSGQGLPSFWCRVYPLLSQIIPTIWHTGAIWLSVFLVVQRYIYVCVPSQVHRFCTPRRTRRAVATIITCSVLTELPELFGKYMERVEIAPGRAMCLLRYSAWVRHGLGVNLFFSLHYWFRVALVHALPCLLLLIFTIILIRTIRRAELRRRSWVFGDGIPPTTPTNEAPPGGMTMTSIIEQYRQHNQRHRNSAPGGAGQWDSNNCRRTSAMTNGGCAPGASGGGRSLYATNKMLAAICTVFLLLELPAAFIFTLHLLLATGIVPSTPHAYRVLNVTLIIRNLLIVLTSPLQFLIYCSMSEQFRLTVRQLFSSRLLFIAQAQPSTFHGGKRYSLILVDVELIRRQQQANRQQLLNRKRHLSLQQRQLQQLQQLQRPQGATGTGGAAQRRASVCPQASGRRAEAAGGAAAAAISWLARPNRKRSAPAGHSPNQPLLLLNNHIPNSPLLLPSCASSTATNTTSTVLQPRSNGHPPQRPDKNNSNL